MVTPLCLMVLFGGLVIGWVHHWVRSMVVPLVLSHHYLVVGQEEGVGL